jgi:glucose/arabinose dehydrogenase
VGNQFWVTSMGSDNLGPDKPEDLMHMVARDGFYGWPYYFQYKKHIYQDPHLKDSVKPTGLKQPPIAPVGFKAHSAPLGFEYLTGFADSSLNNSFLVALHGSTTVSRQRGNEVVQILRDGSYIPVVTGFLQGRTEAKRYGRPCDVLQQSSTSFFVTDDKNGVLYYIYKP